MHKAPKKPAWMLHGGILFFFLMLGILVLLSDFLLSNPGGFLGQYLLSTLYWLGFAVYAGASTALLGAAHLVQIMRKRAVTGIIVIACHVLSPAAVGAVFESAKVYYHYAASRNRAAADKAAEMQRHKREKRHELLRRHTAEQEKRMKERFQNGRISSSSDEIQPGPLFPSPKAVSDNRP